ncbi:Ubiquinone biosynthesis protein COQ4, mitochondrial [Mycena chlorophos]|uniref:4-hydroxy-3-methoxy-5-polyprenylbenzoate decarboxylase n=1 Tax=Mycena chlorophos TaxID=658473 RepID=A0A8H6RYF2_MYCCL|nr:Ubiquinone biosynthesis protein COQ4, mitochondrial [Mycena chlorophos]
MSALSARQLRSSLRSTLPTRLPQTQRYASNKVPAYEGHIPLSWFENGVMAVGSAFMALADPRRGDMVAALGETTAGPALPRLRDIMLASPEGRQILKDRPRINSTTVDLDKLAKMTEGTFGREYTTWLERTGVTPDTREPVHYIDDPELAYVMQRYRECHDFYHCIVHLPVSVDAEIAVKYFEFANLGLPPRSPLGALRTTAPQRDAAAETRQRAYPLGAEVWRQRAESNDGVLGEALGAGCTGDEGRARVVGCAGGQMEEAVERGEEGCGAEAAATGRPVCGTTAVMKYDPIAWFQDRSHYFDLECDYLIDTSSKGIGPTVPSTVH